MISIICPVCQLSFEVYPSRSKQQTCSRPCKNQAQIVNRVTKQCLYCGNDFDVIPSRVKDGRDKYCSYQCSHKAHSGENSNLWCGGKMCEYPKLEQIRKSKDYQLWRGQVFERDLYTCQECGLSGCELNAHHIYTFIEYPELRLDLNNGITLCKDCHLDIRGCESQFQEHFCEKILGGLHGS